MKNITIFHLKIIIFNAFRNCCLLHGHVFVMGIILAVFREMKIVIFKGDKSSRNAKNLIIYSVAQKSDQTA